MTKYMQKIKIYIHPSVAAQFHLYALICTDVVLIMIVRLQEYLFLCILHVC